MNRSKINLLISLLLFFTYTIEMISIDGKLMETIPVNTKKTIIDVSNYAKGNYIAKIVLNNNTTITTRITK